MARKAYIPQKLRQQIETDSAFRCGYCLSPQALLATRLTVDHIWPESQGGATGRDNLWLACERCNRYKSTKTHTLDPLTGEQSLLFNPRTQNWWSHFRWSSDGTKIEGVTPAGRASILAIKLNTLPVVVTRRQWISAGWWPPLS